MAWGICILLLAGCVPAVPPDLIAAIDAIDQDLVALRAPESAPEDYTRFARQWVSLKARVQTDDDLIRWPWESNELENELRQLHGEGWSTLSRLNRRQAAQRQQAESALGRLEARFLSITSHVDSIEGRIALGGKVIFPGPYTPDFNTVFVRNYTHSEGFAMWWGMMCEKWRAPVLSSWWGGLGAHAMILGLPSAALFLACAFTRRNRGRFLLPIILFVLMVATCSCLVLTRTVLFELAFMALAFGWLLEETVIPIRVCLLSAFAVLAAYNGCRCAPAHRVSPCIS